MSVLHGGSLHWKYQYCGATFLYIYRTRIGNSITRHCLPPDNGSTVHRMRRSLSIVFNAGRDVDFSLRLLAHDTWEKLLAFIAQYRLEELELVYPINDVALKLPDHVWLSIERLHLEAHDDRPFARQHLFSNFGKLSSLRHLKISGSRNLDGIDRILPWQQMQTLEVRGQGCVTPSWWLCVLRQCRLLERCCITLSKESFTSPVISEEEKIVLANMDYF